MKKNNVIRLSIFVSILLLFLGTIFLKNCGYQSGPPPFISYVIFTKRFEIKKASNLNEVADEIADYLWSGLCHFEIICKRDDTVKLLSVLHSLKIKYTKLDWETYKLNKKEVIIYLKVKTV